MHSEFYIVERTGGAYSTLHPITRMRIVEMGNEVLYSELLVDKEGRIPIFNLINRNSQGSKKGVILIERDRYRPGREYFLEKEARPRGDGLNICGSIYVLKYRPVSASYSRACFSEAQIHFRSEAPPADSPQEARTSVYPEGHNPDMLSIITAEHTRRVTEIHTKIISSNGEIRYIQAVHGVRICNGIERSASVVSMSDVITSDMTVRLISKYNTYVTTGLREVVDKQKHTPRESNYLLQEMQVGNPGINSPSFYYDLVYHVLLEHRIIMISQSHACIVNVMQSLLACILPYKWRGVLVASTPEEPDAPYNKLVETTIPYIIGIVANRPDVKSINKNVPEKTVIAYLEEERIVIHTCSKEKRGVLNKMYRNVQNRRSLPFYQGIVKRMDFSWPSMKEQMNILMEVISTEAATAREKVIRQLVFERNSERLRHFINGHTDHAKDMLRYLPRNKDFYSDFLGTALYNDGVQNEYTREVKEDGIETKELVTIVWVLAYVSLEGVKAAPNFSEIAFIVEAYITEYMNRAYAAADALLIGLFSVFSFLGMYDLIVYVGALLRKKGVEITDEMCNALGPQASAETLQELRTAGSYMRPWEREKSRKAPPNGRESAKESFREIWKRMPFVHGKILNTLRKCVCLREEAATEEAREHIEVLLRAYDEYELPY
ncbi:uncharacterized protein NEMAJ01_1548 [Nematocida major]|uniref:uncharacterized protein n=1 Tax=Nematocida major TaxID=1912982 RepID=UPI002008AD33|nr:uncharacterized protein NEMAJ01_1548 [Nematocida major]KAH9386652.1 hypothetical protein NEMAJ01_1548 [Nematocida major]